jgi:RHS repeat-associated protein
VGRLASEVSPKGNVQGGQPLDYTTSYVRNAFGDKTLVTDPLGHQTHYTYDGVGNLTRLVDANTHTTINTYDADNEVTQVQRADNSLIKTSYDADGNISSQTDGLTNTTQYGSDPLNRKSSMTDALNRVTSYSYDGVGNLTSLSDPLGRVTTYSYDSANQLIGISYSDGITPNVTNQYDADGQRQQMSDGTGATTYTFDSLRRLTQSTSGAGSQVRYAYDIKGQLTSLTYPGGTQAVTRGYDDAGRLHTVTDWLSHTTTLSYDTNSNLTTEAYPNGVTATFTYDNSNRLMGISDSVGPVQLLNLSYSRDNANHLTGENSQAYGYDSINRLTTSAMSSTTYGYDAGDNLTQIALGSSTTITQAYDASHQVTSRTTMNGPTQIQNLTYAYDSNGNRVSQTDQNNVVTTFGWDQANRQINYSAPSTTASYAYNGDGLRLSKTVNSTAEPFVWDTSEAMPTVIVDGSTQYVTDDSGLPLEQISGTTVHYFHRDQLGSTRVLTGASGGAAATYTYDAYGNASVTGSVTSPFQFAGQYTDAESGLVYMRARYYDPCSGQFISRDPAAAFTREAYAYVADNPLNGIDPSGLVCWQFWDSSKCNNTLTQVETWATTQEDVLNPGFITGAANGGLGALRMLTGTALLLAGTVADFTIVGITIGVPAQLAGAYLVGSGALQTYRGYKQFCTAQDHPTVRETPIQYFADVAVGLVPFADVIQKLGARP